MVVRWRRFYLSLECAGYGATAILADMPDLCKAIGLLKVPHFTTLQKAARRLMVSVVSRELLEGTIA